MIWNVLSSTKSLLYTISFNLTIPYCFDGDVELIILSNLEVLILPNNKLG